MGWLFGNDEEITQGGLRAIQNDFDKIGVEVEDSMEELSKDEQRAYASIGQIHIGFVALREAEMHLYDQPTQQALENFKHALENYKKAVRKYQEVKVKEHHWSKHFQSYEKKMEKYLIQILKYEMRHTNVR